MSESTSMSEAALRALWAESERRLYPLATTSPERYEHVIRLARATADRLNDVDGSAQLLPRWNDADSIVANAIADAGLPAGDFSPLDVAGLAFSVRMREVKEAEHRAQQVVRIDGARSQGAEWVQLHEKGALEHGLMDTYSSIEMHLASGAAMVCSVEQNPQSAAANFVLTVILMDVENGQMIDMDPGIFPMSEHDTADELTRAVSRARSTIAALPTGGPSSMG